MKNIIKGTSIIGVFWLSLSTSCGKFEQLNTDPNNISPTTANANYLMAQVLTSSAKDYGNLGSGDMSGAMQQTAQDAWSGGYSNYQWDPKDWSGFYGRLRDNKLMLEKAEANNWKFHQGVGLIMRAFNFGCIADLWGDAPYSKALNGDQTGTDNTTPAFDTQEQIYDGVIADLKAALPMLEGSASDFPEVNPSSDVFYEGDPEKWRKVANSLLLRYYLRLSDKRDVRADVEAVAANVFESNDDDWAMSYPGIDQNSSYQKNSKFNSPSNYNRNKMSATLVKKLDELKDPRIVIMAEPVIIRTKVDASKFSDNTTLSKIINGIRYINPPAALAAKDKQFDINTYATDRPWGAPSNTVWNFYDTSAVYVGIPISYAGETYQYNLNATGTQSTSANDYVSYMRRDIYDNPSHPLLKAQMASYAEICFDLAEAAQKGWNVGGSAEEWYNKGIKASFDTWLADYQDDVDAYDGAVKSYEDYIAQPLVAYNGTLERIMEQKWIASWQASTESWMDWRRTGFPRLQIGWASFRGQIPVRYAYFNTELQNNPANAEAAIQKLEETDYSTVDGKNSSWSKFWLTQGTNKPW
ncbi:MAG: SusD/RagB family nutrient-binding outer membrane lipoprotein [Agriterribacter sp.]